MRFCARQIALRHADAAWVIVSPMRLKRGAMIGSAVGASLLATAIATAAPAGRTENTARVNQQLLSRSASGGMPNAPATDPVFSWDGRIARYAAYMSAATNIRPGTGGRRNVFLVRRDGGSSGSPWKFGSTTLASPGIGGQPANGDSFSPALDGQARGDAARGPTCLAFVSEASNLVGGDTNGRADVFVRRLSSGKLKRIPSPAGKPASDVAVSGTCKEVVYVAGSSLYVKRNGAATKKVADGGARSPSSTFNGRGLTYAKGSSIYAGSISGNVRRVAQGSNPAPDGGDDTSNRNRGKVRYVSYERGGKVRYRRVGGFNRIIGSPGKGGHPTAGGGQVIFGSGRFVYMYAVSNNFGTKSPKGFCPAGGGDVTKTYTSGRGNYIVFSCSGGGVYLSYVGPK